MTNLSKKFTTLGLRRDRNLSDVEDPVIALNSLLNNLVSEPNKTFISEDLDAIRKLQISNVNSTKLSSIAGSTVKATVQNGEIIQEVPLTPAIRFIDRIENMKTVTGDTPSISGGDGLMARFIPPEDINTATANSTGDNIFTIRNTQNQEVFWDSGYFNLPKFIDGSFSSEHGGIQWTGFMTPEVRDPNVNLIIRSTGLVMFELDRNEDNNWEVLHSTYAETRNITLSQAYAAPSSTLALAANQYKYIAAGDIVVGVTDVTVTSVTPTAITVSSPITSTTILTVKKELGKTLTQFNVLLPPRDLSDTNKIRISFWFPTGNTSILDKIIEFSYIGGTLYYPYLYTVKPSAPKSGEIREFLTNAISPYQIELGTTTAYKNLYVNNSLKLQYNPSLISTFQSVRKTGAITMAFSANETLVSTTSPIALEPGDIIVPVNVGSPITKVLRIGRVISQFLYALSEPPGFTGSILVSAITHIGFINWFETTVSGNTVTVTKTAGMATPSVADLATGFIVIAATSLSLNRITNVNNAARTFTTANQMGAFSLVMCVYSDRSLVDRSKDVFCQGVFGQVVALTALVDANTITLSSVAGVVINQIVQFSGAIAENTRVLAINANTITISTPLIGNLAGSSTVVFVPEILGGSLNREGCVIPLDTAPPFVGTEIGLSSNGRGIKSIDELPKLSVTVDELKIVTDTSSITPTDDTVIDRKIPIRAVLNGVLSNFSILGRSIN